MDFTIKQSTCDWSVDFLKAGARGHHQCPVSSLEVLRQVFTAAAFRCWSFMVLSTFSFVSSKWRAAQLGPLTRPFKNTSSVCLKKLLGRNISSTTYECIWAESKALHTSEAHQMFEVHLQLHSWRCLLIVGFDTDRPTSSGVLLGCHRVVNEFFLHKLYSHPLQFLVTRNYDLSLYTRHCLVVLTFP